MLHPEKYKELLPFIQSVDKYYKQLIPSHYEKQYKKAKQTHFKIPRPKVHFIGEPRYKPKRFANLSLFLNGTAKTSRYCSIGYILVSESE